MVDERVPNTCALSVPVFQPVHGLNSDQVDKAHQDHILGLNRIIDCFIQLLDKAPIRQ